MHIMSPLFKNRKLVIATMHQKELLMQPILENVLGVECLVLGDFNSDKFGTFTRDIKRSGNMLQAARAKLQAAMEMSGCDLGVASEGSFGVHPSMPFVQSNLELVLFIDKKNNLEIKGHYRTLDTNLDGKYVSTIEEALNFAKKCGFPEHGVIVRRSEKGKWFLYKNIQNIDDLKTAFNKILSLPFSSKVFIETDMRAYKNPTRMKAIQKATEDLIQNIHSKCPECKRPGFVLTDVEKGLPCRVCSMPTALVKFEIFSCASCAYQEKKKTLKYGEFADPGQCNFCNP